MRKCNMDVVARSAEVQVETLHKHDITSLQAQVHQKRVKVRKNLNNVWSRRSINIRSTKNRLTHNSMLRGWISILACRCGCNFYNINRWNRICTDRKTR